MNKKKIITYIVALFFALMFIFGVAFNQEKATKNKEHEKKGKQQTEEVTKENIEVKIVEEKTETEIAQEEFQSKLDELNCNCTLSKEDWFKQYKLLIDEYADILGKPKTIYDRYTSQELELLFRVVQAEIGSQYSFEQKCNVVSVIYNRLADPRFGNTINEILVGHQFSTISNGAIYKVNIDERTILACEYVFQFGDTTGGALFFDSNGVLKYMFLFNDGAHNFYTKGSQ